MTCPVLQLGDNILDMQKLWATLVEFPNHLNPLEINPFFFIQVKNLDFSLKPYRKEHLSVSVCSSLFWQFILTLGRCADRNRSWSRKSEVVLIVLRTATAVSYPLSLPVLFPWWCLIRETVDGVWVQHNSNCPHFESRSKKKFLLFECIFWIIIFFVIRKLWLKDFTCSYLERKLR